LKAAESLVKAFTPTGAIQSIGKKLFCFLPDTLVEMLDGRVSPIGWLQLGDETRGGKVESIRRAMADDVFNYHGVKVSGGHAVLDRGEWKRIRDCKDAELIHGEFEVVSIVTSKHRVYVEGVTFADEFETPAYEWLDLNESIAALNSQRMEAFNGSASL
jgi:hypothetical protein